jgi:hypothetical protein
VSLALVTAFASFALVAAACGDDSTTAHESTSKPAARATLMPSSTSPLRLKGTGFHAGEHVNVTVTPSASEGVTRRVRAGRSGSFSLGFPGIDACGGIEGVANQERPTGADPSSNPAIHSSASPLSSCGPSPDALARRRLA